MIDLLTAPPLNGYVLCTHCLKFSYYLNVMYGNTSLKQYRQIVPIADYLAINVCVL